GALQMAIGHIHVLARTAIAMMQALRCRSVTQPSARKMFAATGTQGAVLLHKSIEMSHEVHRAMLARGFSGTFPMVEPRTRWKAIDYALVFGALAIMTGSGFK